MMPGIISIFFFVSTLAIMGVMQSTSAGRLEDNVRGWDISLFDKYRFFVSVANDYMAANPTFSGTAYWATLSAKAPPALAAIQMPAAWKIVADGSSFVICTAMPSDAVAALGKHLNGGQYQLINASTNKLVVGKPDEAASVQAEADKCS